MDYVKNVSFQLTAYGSIPADQLMSKKTKLTVLH